MICLQKFLLFLIGDQLSQDLLDPFSRFFLPSCRYLIDYHVSVPLFPKAQETLLCQPILRPNWLTYLHLEHWRSETDWDIGTPMADLTAQWIGLHDTSCKHSMNFGPVTSEIKCLICVLVWKNRKITDLHQFLQSCMSEKDKYYIYLVVIRGTLLWWPINFIGNIIQHGLYHFYYLHWRSTTIFDTWNRPMTI